MSGKEPKTISSEDLRDCLRRVFPESVEQVAEVERAWPGDPGVNTYTYMSEVFWWGIFQPAIAHRDRAQLAKCFRLMENFLASDDSDLRDAAGIRVTPYLADPALEDLVEAYAGLRLREDLVRVRGSLPDL